MIEVFNDIDEALLWIENKACDAATEEGFKAEIFRTFDGRWRCGIVFDSQLELPLGD
jgi:hypothetical protein